MAEEALKIRIGADVGQAVKGIQQVDKSLKTLTPSAGRSAQALTNLSRIAQDAPFGFIGIANNIEPLLQSFQALRKESGSTGGALKSLGASLLGGGGLILAFGALSFALSGGIPMLRDFANSIGLIKLDPLISANRELAKSMAEASGKAAGEVATLGALISIAQDESLSRDARTEAINKINKEYDEYLPKLSLENIQTDAVRAAIDKLTQSLIRQAKIKGVQDLISKEAQKQAELLNDALSNETTIMDDLKGAFTSILPSFGAAGAKINRLNKEFDASAKKAGVFNDALRELLKDEALGGTLDAGEKDIKIPKVKLKADKLEIAPQSVTISGVVSTAVPEVKNPFSPAAKAKPSGFDPFEKEKQGYIEAAQAAKELQDRNDAIAHGITQTLSPAFTNFFDDLLSGSKTTFADFGKAILGVIKKLVAAAAAAAVLAAIITVATGGGAAAFGANFMKGFGGLTGIDLGSITGNSANFGSGALMGSANRNMTPKIVGVVEGQKLNLILQRYNGDVNRGG